MTAMTYEQHKAAIDAAMPTPTLTWEGHTDNPAHLHDEQAVAQASADFDGQTYDYEVHIVGTTLPYYWVLYRVNVEDGARVATGTRPHTWAEMKVAAQNSLASTCESVRRRAAIEAHALGVLAADGITAILQPGLKLTGLTASGAAVGNVVLTPVFSADVLTYAGSISLGEITLTATLPTGATIAWAMGETAHTTAAAMFDLTTGENVITATVSAPGHEDTVYTITITKT